MDIEAILKWGTLAPPLLERANDEAPVGEAPAEAGQYGDNDDFGGSHSDEPGGGATTSLAAAPAVAASSARAGLEAAIINIEINRTAIRDEAERVRLGDAIAGLERDLDRAAAVVATVRKGLAR